MGAVCQKRREDAMANTALLQVRTSAENQEKSTEILEKLGTNLSIMVNIL